MKILAMDTTGNACSVAIVSERGIIAELFTNIEKNHSVMLMPMIDELLSKCGMCVSDADYIAVTSGPGSFTGLRIGGATAKALAHAASLKIIPVPTLDALAYNVFSYGDIVVPIMDARRNQVYTAFYRRLGKRITQISEYMAKDIGEILKMPELTSVQAVFTGDAVEIYEDIIRESGHEAAPCHLRLQRASAVGALAVMMHGDAVCEVAYDSFTPFYLRIPQAEREFREKNT